MRKFGVNRKNPNPPWPNEQSVVVVPPGTAPGAVGKNEEKISEAYLGQERTTPQDFLNSRQNMNTVIQEDKTQPEMAERVEPEEVRSINNAIPDVPEDRQRPIKGYIPETSMRNSDYRSGEMREVEKQSCNSLPVNGYLCSKIGKFVRIEFLFGENTHIEKTGVLQSVGKDFIVLLETGSNNSIVCSVNNIKFINIYNIKDMMNDISFKTPEF